MAERRIIKGWIVERGPDGTMRPIGPATQQAQMPTDPTFPTKGPKAVADLSNTQASTTRTQVQTVGDTLSNRQAEQKLTQNPIADRDQALINQMRLAQGDLPGVLRDITGAKQAVDQFQPSPGKGILYGMGVPEDGDWPLTAGIKSAIGSFLPNNQKQAYQTLTGLQNQAVLNAQIAQKGPQTESDAIRMKLAGVSLNKDVNPNKRLLSEQQYDTIMKMRRPGFYEQWANERGSTHALGKDRRTADDTWNGAYEHGLQLLRKKLADLPKKAAPASSGWGKVEVRD